MSSNPFYWILPGLLAGCPGPKQATWNLEALWEEGFRTIVSLCHIDGEDIRTAGFRHIYRPLLGWMVFLPPLQHWLVNTMLPVVDQIAGELMAHRPTLVHCYYGKDRTGAVLAGYLMRHRGLSWIEAIEQVKQANPRAMSAPGFIKIPRLFEIKGSSK